MAKSKIDGIAIGEQLRQEMTDTWLKSALACFELADDKDAMNEFRAAFGRNPKHIIKAVERFPNIFHADNHPDLFDILAAILLSKVKDDIEAENMFDDFQKNKDYDLLKGCIKEYCAENRAPRAKRKANAEKCATCERVNALPNKWRKVFTTDDGYLRYRQCADELDTAMKAGDDG